MRFGNKPLNHDASAERALDVFTLISQEREQQLDLLKHLLANRQSPIIVCGPAKIGKTRLLKKLQEQPANDYRFCLLTGDPSLNFELIQAAVAERIQQKDRDKVYQSITHTLDAWAGQGKKLVLILENAGVLNPGLANEIIKWVSEKSALRLIFVLSHDELYLKNITDKILDDCFLIEIPPLSEKQCGDFLRYLLVNRRINLSVSEINDDVVARIYQQSQGLPGKIIDVLTVFPRVKKLESPLVQLIVASVVLVGLALALQWLSHKPGGLQLTLPYVYSKQPASDNNNPPSP